MRVVNDRRRLPRVAWGGNAVIQTRRGELKGVGLDLSADGMAILAPIAGKAKERIRIHTQLGDFPLLTDARVVRMTKRRDGYRWAIRFEQMDQRMRANLEAYVRQQLSSTARIRQAQLYAERLKAAAMPPLTPFPTTGSGPMLPTPGPQPAVTPTPDDPSQPLMEAELPPMPPGAAPLDLGPDPGAAPLVDLESDGQRALEIELPDMPQGQVPSFDTSALEPPRDPTAYTPYQDTDAEEEAALLGEGPLTPKPEERPPRMEAEPLRPESPERRAPRDASARVMRPGVIEIDDEEELSLEDILAEVEGNASAPVTDLELPEPSEAPKEVSGLGDVPVIDEAMGDDEETRRRDSVDFSIPAQADEDGTTLRVTSKPRAEASAEAASSTQPETEASVAAFEPEPERSTRPSDAPTAAQDFAGLPFDAGEDVSTEGAPLDELAQMPAHSDDAPPFEDAPALSDAPAFEEGPSGATPMPTLTPAPVEGSPERLPSLDSALLRTTAPTPPPMTPSEAFAASPSASLDEDDSERVSVSEPDISGPEGGADPQPPAFLDEAPPPEASPRATPVPAIYPDDAQPFDPYEPNPASATPLEEPVPKQLGSAPRAIGELPPPVSGLYTPASNPNFDDDEDSGAYAATSFEPFPSVEEGLYGDRSDVTFEEQQGNPRQRLAFLQQDDQSTHSLAEQHDLFLGDIEGVTTGLTPTPFKRHMTDENLVPAGEPEQGVPEPAEAEATRPVDVSGPAIRDADEELVEAKTTHFTPAPEELSDADVEFEDESVAEAERPAGPAGFATYPDFNVIPDYDQPLEGGASQPAGQPPAQSGRTIVASFESLGMEPPEDAQLPNREPTIPGDFAPVASFEGAAAPLAGFTVVADLDDEQDGAGTLSGSTMIASAQDVESWKKAAAAKPVPRAFDEQRTGSYTPPPGSIEHATSSTEDALTTMRVSRGAHAGGAGFELNPRGPAPLAAVPRTPTAPVARVPLAKMRVPAKPSATVPAPGVRSGDTVRADLSRTSEPMSAPSTRPTLPPGNPRVPAQAPAAGPGPSARRTTTVGHPSPRTSPGNGAPSPTPAPGAAIETRRSLVEGALADLKRKTESKRKTQPTSIASEEAKPAKPTRRRRRAHKIEHADPALAELYKAAMSDIEGS